MSDHDFQIEILNQMRDLAVGQSAIATDMAAVKDHLKTLNGKVASHEKQLNERQNQCPLVDLLEPRVRMAEDFITAEKASEKTSSTWLKWLWPVIWAAVGIAYLLVLQHSSFLLRAFIH
jgi:hypothetical protein